MSSTSSRARIWTALWVVYIVWGSTYLAIRYVVKTIPPFLGAGMRYVIAGSVLAAILVAVKGRTALKATRRQILDCAFVGTCLCVGGNGLVMIAEQSVPSGLAALIIACTPLFVVVLRRTGGERPARATVGGVLLGLVGVAVLLLPGSSPHGVKGIHLVLNVLAPMSWSIGSYYSSRRPLPANPLAGSAYQMFSGGVLMFALAGVMGDYTGFHLSQVSGQSWWSLAYLIGPGAILAMSAYVWLLGNAPISLVSTYAFVNPVVAVFLGAVISDEKITGGTLIGGAVIVISVAVVVWAQAQDAKRRAIAVEDLIAPAEAPQPA